MSVRAARLALAAGIASLPLGARAALGPLYGGEATLAVPALPPSLEPGVPGDAVERLLAALVHETLVGMGPDGLVVAGLARECASSASGREWTLTLHEGLLRQDGHPLTTEDAARSLLRFLRSGSAAAARLAGTLEGGTAFAAGRTRELPGLETEPPLRLRLRCLAPTAQPLAPLTSAAAAVTGGTGAGAGPFVPAGPPSRTLRLTPFSAHVRGRPLLDGVRVVASADARAREALLRTGRAHLVPGRPGPSTLASTLLLVLDPTRPPFDRAAVRAAISAGLPRADLVAHFVPGGESTLSPLPPTVWLPPEPASSATAPASPRVPGAAFALAVASDVPERVSQRVVAYLDALGLPAAVTVHPPRRARAARGARLLLFTPEVPEPELALRELLALGPPSPAALAALDAAARQMEPDRRQAIVSAAETALREAHVVLPLAAVPVSFRTDGRLRDARVDRGGRLLLEDAWLRP